MRTKSPVPPPANFVSDHITELIMITLGAYQDREQESCHLAIKGVSDGRFAACRARARILT